jgi:exodeoxyribonuclease VII large subunit
VALTSSAESPVPVRTVARLLGSWIDRLGRIWVEGQVTGLRPRPGVSTVFFTLRDPVADVSMPVTATRELCAGLADGARVVVWAKPSYYLNRGSLTLAALDIRPVGVGELLARLERLRALLTTEGLFAAERKRALPFLPRTIGLICGRASAAERDVRETASRRWPAVRFRIEEVAVQGPYAVTEVTSALGRLNADRGVEVIVLARGGGSVEDLLPFSDEALCRAVAASRTPVVSAIGHEQDVPLVDLVADRRASTPTDAGKLVVPDVAEELAGISHLRHRGRRALRSRVDREQAVVASLRSRPVLAAPAEALERRAADVSAARDRGRRCLHAALHRAENDLAHTRARVRALSPAATLARGYAVVQRRDRTVVRAPVQVSAGEPLRIRLADGEIAARVTSAP